MVSIDLKEYAIHPLPGCLPILLEADNYLAFRDYLVKMLGDLIPGGDSVGMYNLIVEASPSHLIDAREYVLNELQYEIRRAKSVVNQMSIDDSESEILHSWTLSLAERADGRIHELGNSDDVLDLFNAIKANRISRNNMQ